MMEIVAKSKYIRQSPRKLRLVAKQIGGLPANEAQVFLENLNKKAARLILLTLKQGVGNAVNNFQLNQVKLTFMNGQQKIQAQNIMPAVV